mmetsp:Transcript_15209/g.32161  ORF Transcript_15209/g.32161 Transcript_15209/m.32161 type:complete len:410 (+) Transcript_15209:84-1313(+)
MLCFYTSLFINLMLPIAICRAEKLEDGGIISSLIDWVNGFPGGFFNSEKLEILPIQYAPVPTETTTFPPLGVFAKADVAANELLMQIPPSAYIEVWGGKLVDDESWDVYYHNMCLLSKKLETEMHLGDESLYAPYIRFLNKQAKGQIPATWSNDARDILRELLPEEIDGLSNGVDWIDDHFKGSCISPFDAFQEHIVALVKQRCYDDALIPLWDMVNHANGPHINTNTTSWYDNGGIKVWASQLIREGEEVFASYDGCVDCSTTAREWGTLEILRDFGFVEGYPHRYIYEDEDIWFEVVEVDKENDSLAVLWDDHINWEDGERFGAPDREGIEFLRSEVEEYEYLDKLIEERDSLNVTPFEWSVIMQTKEVVVKDFILAIEEAELVLGMRGSNDDFVQTADGSICAREF